MIKKDVACRGTAHDISNGNGIFKIIILRQNQIFTYRDGNPIWCFRKRIYAEHRDIIPTTRFKKIRPIRPRKSQIGGGYILFSIPIMKVQSIHIWNLW